MDHCDTIDKLFFPLEEVDELVVHDQDERAPDGAEHVGEVALEEGLAALVLEDLGPAVHGALVHLLPLAGHHHESAPHGVEGVGHGHGAHGHGLRDGELCADVGVLHHLLGGVVGAEVDGAVDYDPLDVVFAI